MTLNVLLLADSDSQLLACQALTRHGDGQDVRFTVNAIPREGTPASVLQALERSGPLWRLTPQQLLADPRLDGFTAIGVYLTGSKLAEFRNGGGRGGPCSAASTAWCWSASRRRSPGAWATT